MRKFPGLLSTSRALPALLSLALVGLGAAAASAGCSAEDDPASGSASGGTGGGGMGGGGLGGSSGSSTCAAGFTDCGDGCVDLTRSSMHCGACGEACASGRACEGGVCACVAPLVDCAGACVSTQESAAHCGGCDLACPAGQVCSGGRCQVSCGSLTQCGSDCADLAVSPLHCGQCDHPCVAGQSCVAGVCTCDGGLTICAGVCRDLTTDGANCGSCGHRCAADESCTLGICTANTEPGSGGTAGSGGASGGEPITGGQGTGGVAGTGGQSTGGQGTGGQATGGQATGGQATGGQSSGGQATGGEDFGPTGLPASCSGNCDAATPVNPTRNDYGTLGNVTVYSTSASNAGACGYGSTGVMYYAAINTFMEWDGGHVCGQCMRVTVLTSEGEKSVVVRVMDKCPDGNCGIDLGGTAPGEVMIDGAGRYEGAWRPVSCVGQPGVSDGAPSLWVKDGASPGWSIVQIRNPNAAVTGIDWQEVGDPSNQGTLAWATEAENYYSIPTTVLGAGSSFLFTIHYADGSIGTVTLTSSDLARPMASYPLD